MTDIIQYLEWTVSDGLGRWLGSVIILFVIAAGLTTTIVSASNIIRNALGK